MAEPGRTIRSQEKLTRGDKGEWRHTFTNETTGAAIDMSGKTWRATWRAAAADGSFDYDGAVLATSTIDATDAADGVILETLPSSQSELLASSPVWVDLESTDATDPEDVRTWIMDKVKIQGAPSHD